MRLAPFKLAVLPLVAFPLSSAASSQVLLHQIDTSPEAVFNQVAALGDLDHDGFDDFIIGMPEDSTAGALAGKVVVYSGATGSQLFEIFGPGASGRFGGGLGPAGDVNGDGTPDFIVGAPFFNSSRGWARVYSGSNGAPLLTMTSLWQQSRLGASVGTVGDYNGDGRDDPFASSPDHGSTQGIVRITSGLTGQILKVYSGKDFFESFGRSAAGAGDCNGDGIPDILVGAPGYRVDGKPRGAARLFAGGPGFFEIATFEGEEEGSMFGTFVDAGHDWNNDGFDDFLVASSGGQLVRVFSGADQAVLWEVRDLGGPSGLTGCSVAFAGDVDGDGHADVVMGLPQLAAGGLVRIYSGAEGCVLYQIEGPGPQPLGFSVAGGADWNGDGRADWLTTAYVSQTTDGFTAAYAGRGGLGQPVCAPAQPNSTGMSGTLRAVGSALPGENDMVLLAGQLPVDQAALLLVSPSAGFTPNPGGSQGDLCLGGPVGRYNSQLQVTGAAGSTSFNLDLSQTPTPTGQTSVLSGQSWYWQTWYRDQNPGSTSNFTSAVMATFL